MLTIDGVRVSCCRYLVLQRPVIVHCEFSNPLFQYQLSHSDKCQLRDNPCYPPAVSTILADSCLALLCQGLNCVSWQDWQLILCDWADVSGTGFTFSIGSSQVGAIYRLAARKNAFVHARRGNTTARCLSQIQWAWKSRTEVFHLWRCWYPRRYIF